MNALFQRLFQHNTHKHFIDYVATVNSGISAITLFPQLFAVLKGQTTDGLSYLSFFLIALNSCIWFAYGIHRHIPPLIFSSVCNALASIGILMTMCFR